jgi:hypothetical protein
VDLLLSDLVRTSSGDFDSSKVTLKLDGVNVTSQAQIRAGMTHPASRATILYQPTADLTLGTHQVQFTYPGVSGPMTETWNFSAANIMCGTGTTALSSEATAPIGADQPPSDERVYADAPATGSSMGTESTQSEGTAATATAPVTSETWQRLPHPGLFSVVLGSTP